MAAPHENSAGPLPQAAESWAARAELEPATARITTTAPGSTVGPSATAGPGTTMGPGVATGSGSAMGSNSTTETAQHIDNTATPWQPTTAPHQAAAANHWVPDRIDRSSTDSAPRVEVLPAAMTSMDLLADIAAANRARLQSSSGVRGALNKVGFRLGLSPAEQRTEDRRARIRRQLNTTYQIAVISVKGGVGRTTTAATLGSAFAALRPDRVVAVDGNPDFGDLPTRTAPHPYGLTLRDLAQASNLEAFSTVQSFMSINSADLAVIASPWTVEANEALSGREYTTAVEVLRRHFNLLLVDCGTGVLDSITQSVLQTSDAVVVVTPPTVGGVKGAVATLNWLSSHGMQHLIAKSVVSIVHQQPSKPVVDVSAIEKLFASGQRPTCILPYDVHLAEGGEIDLRLLEKETLLAFEELAAGIADGFPNYLGGTGGGRAAGGWR
ncbi:MinD/ParA family protein [Nocardia sp. NBC_00565]|uniref:MinD/ParA family ATP-binding protein n=1 Tax=Nocardia sp. NBC_00565 TaxID=2975993 RepID=UPI002E81A946|nr:MinD/ParA family protein [Nocardia sp. NBC_00565]WUC07663.1 MinD/ParA family protein [Nocardia sp. NBC_00565]